MSNFRFESLDSKFKEFASQITDQLQRQETRATKSWVNRTAKTKYSRTSYTNMSVSFYPLITTGGVGIGGTSHRDRGVVIGGTSYSDRGVDVRDICGF